MSNVGACWRRVRAHDTSGRTFFDSRRGSRNVAAGGVPAHRDGTRGERAFSSGPPRKGGGMLRLRVSSAPCGAGPFNLIDHHGFRFVRLSADCAPPVATFLDPSGVTPILPPERSELLATGPLDLYRCFRGL